MAELLKAGRSRKGLDPIVAEILIIVMVLGLGLVIWGWESGYIGAEQRETSGTMDCAFARVAVQDVYITPSGGNVLIKNTGSIDLEIIHIALLDKNGTSAPVSSPKPPFNLTVGMLKQVSFDTSHFPCSTFGSVTLFTSCPGLSPVFYGPPKC